MNQREVVLGRAHVIAGELDVRQGEDLAFADVDGDEDILLVRGDRDLGRIDLELHVTTVEVIRTQGFQVTRELLARVLVFVGKSCQPAAGAEGELVEQVFFFKGLVADDIDRLDARGLTFHDGDIDRHAVALQRGDGGLEFDRVLALVVELALQFRLDAVEHRAVEGAAFGQAGIFQAFAQRLFLDRLVTAEIDLGDGRALVHDHDQHIAFALEAHIFEEAGAEQCTHQFAAVRIGHRIAGLHRQVIEHRASGDALQAFDADILDLEGLTPGKVTEKSQCQKRQNPGCKPHSQNLPLASRGTCCCAGADRAQAADYTDRNALKATAKTPFG